MTAEVGRFSGFELSELGMLARVLESFTETLDLDEVLRRVVRITLEEFGADRAWILEPVDLTSEYARVACEVTRPGQEGAMRTGESIPLADSRGFITRVEAAGAPLESTPDTPDIDGAVLRKFNVQSQLIQIITTRDGNKWAFGLHQCDRARRWSDSEKRLFGAVGRYAAVAINNAMLHRQALADAATVNAVLNQIPEAAAIFGPDGALIQMNAIARTQRTYLFGMQAEDRLSLSRHRDVDGRPLAASDLPSMRALRGEEVNGDYRILDTNTGEDRVVNYRAAPVRNAEGTITGSVVMSRDVTEDRAAAEQERWRRKRAETLGGLPLDLVTHSDVANLDPVARHIGLGMQVGVRIHLYRPASDVLVLAGAHAVDAAMEALHQYIRKHPHRPGEGLAGTVFQIGKPLLFAEAKEDALTGFARSDEERGLIEKTALQGLIGCPIDAYGERLGALVISHVDPRRTFKAEDLAFVSSVAERLAAAYHIYRLNRLSAEGLKASEDLARREVDARARLEAVLESAPIGIAVVSADELRFEIINNGWMEMARRYGRMDAETVPIGLRVDEMVPHLESVLALAAERNEVRIDRAIPVRFQGQTYYYDRIISPVRGRLSGSTQSLTILVQDVTEAVRAKQEIEALVRMMEDRTARLDSILGSMTDALWVFDIDGDVIDVNRSALSMFGLASQSDAIARGSFEDFHLRYPDGRPIAAAEFPYERALRGEIVPDFIAVGAHLITSRDIDLSIAAAPIRSGGAVVGAVLVIRDISALQELDRKKDEFLSVASHELRTPLTTIRGYAQLLTQLIFDIGPEERSTYLHSMLGEIDRMMGLISELLDVSRIQRNRLQVSRQEMQWVEFVRTLVQAASVQHTGRTIEFAAETESLRLMADPQRMRQVIDNLLSNALKYSPESSTVVVRVTTEGDLVRTSVTDRGIGIPADELSHLFERFHRARNVSSRYYGGLGLGLYISKAIVESHGGRIAVETREGEGSTFIVELPLVEES